MYDNIIQIRAAIKDEVRKQVADGAKEARAINTRNADQAKKTRLEEMDRTIDYLDKKVEVKRAYRSLKIALKEYPDLASSTPIEQDEAHPNSKLLHVYATMIILYDRIIDDLENLVQSHDVSTMQDEENWLQSDYDALTQLATKVKERYKAEGDLDQLMRRWVALNSAAFEGKIPTFYKDNFPLNL